MSPAPAPTVVRFPAGGRELAQAVAATDGGHDLLLVAACVELPDDAVEKLLAAAEDTTVATASALAGPDPAATPLHPRIPLPSAGPCVLVRRWALDLIGPLDPSFLTARGTVEDAAERWTLLGLSHVLADDLAVDGHWDLLDPIDAERLTIAYPHRAVAARMASAPGSPLQASLAAIAVRHRPLRVTIDGRALGPYRAGTQLHAMELIAALARTGRADVRVLIADDLSSDVAATFAAHPRITTITYDEAAHGDPASGDIVYRPSQVFSADDLFLLLPLGSRLVITHQDLIAYRSPALHATPEQWERHRDATRLSLGVADHVTFLSDHGLQDALAEALVDPTAASVVAIGVDHQVAVAPQLRPDGVPETPFLLVLGAGLPHKNRAFATRLLDVLRDDGWDGGLVIAGPDQSPSPTPGVTVVGSVSEAEKAWLLAHAAVVLYPTLYEGFGLIPFEAAAAGTPSAWAPVASLAEVLPPQLATLVPWDLQASARAVRALIDAPEEHVHGVRERAGRYRWDTTARQFIERFEALLAAPQTPAVRGAQERIRLMQELEASHETRRREARDFASYKTRIGDDAIDLTDALSPADRRALLALATKEPLRRALLPPMRGAYRALKRWA